MTTFAPSIPGEDLYSFMQRARMAVLAGQDQVEAALADAYRGIWYRATGRLSQLTSVIDEARDAGITVSRNWLFQQERYKQLVGQLSQDYGRFAEMAYNVNSVAAETAIANGAVNIFDATGRALGPQPASMAISFGQPNTEAIVASVMANQSKALLGLWGGYASVAADGAKRVLQDGVALGWSSQKIAAELRLETGFSYNRAQTIARTETMRAYREGARAGMTGNQDILVGWVWQSAQNLRTCAFCWAQQGTLFPFNKDFGGASAAQMLGVPVHDAPKVGLRPMETHPNCRCALVPRAKSYGEILGNASLKDRRPKIVRGETAFRKLTEEQQRAILGKRRYEMYKSGEIKSLKDFITYRESPVWGRQPRYFTLAQLGATLPSGQAAAILRALQRAVPWSKSIPPTEVDLREAWKLNKQLVAELEKITGLKSSWTGKMIHAPPRLNAMGVFDSATGEAMIDPLWWRSAPPWQKFQVMSHEMLHSLSPGLPRTLSEARNLGKNQYTQMWEESVTEGYAKTIRNLLQERTGQYFTFDRAGNPMPIDWSGYDSPYDDGIDYLEGIGVAILKPRATFWSELYHTPFAQRYAKVEQWITAAPGGGSLLTDLRSIWTSLRGLGDPYDPRFRWMLEGRLEMINNSVEDAISVLRQSAVTLTTRKLFSYYEAWLGREVRSEAREYWGLEPDQFDKRVESIARTVWSNILQGAS